MLLAARLACQRVHEVEKHLLHASGYDVDSHVLLLMMGMHTCQPDQLHACVHVTHPRALVPMHLTTCFNCLVAAPSSVPCSISSCGTAVQAVQQHGEQAVQTVHRAPGRGE